MRLSSSLWAVSGSFPGLGNVLNPACCGVFPARLLCNSLDGADFRAIVPYIERALDAVDGRMT